MQSSHQSVLNTLVRVQRFLDSHDSLLGSVNQSGYRGVLDEAAAALSEHAAVQTTSKRTSASEAAKERVLRSALKLNHMRPIATVAAAQLSHAPQFVALKMPPTNATSRALIAWASSMSTAASAYTSIFVAAGLPADFDAELLAASNALAETIGNRHLNRTQLTGATAGLDEQSTRGRQAVKVLNSLVEPKLRGSLSLLTAWNTAKRFTGRSTGVPATTVDAAASGPSVVQAPVTGSVAGAPASP